MSFISLTQATHLLAIDGKTLHRWLAQAHLCPHAHPSDGRLKGLTPAQLLLVASTHHRSLAALPQEPPALAQPCPPAALPALPADLLTLPEQLAALQAQLVTLQQQVTDLTRLLHQQRSEPAIPAVATKQRAKPTRAAPAATASAKTPPKLVHVIARVEYSQQGHYVVICPTRGLLPFEPDTPPWFAWVAQQDSFRFVGKQGRFTAHHEWRVPKGAWRAHRHIRNRVHTQRLAPNQELTIAVLEQAATTFQALLT